MQSGWSKNLVCSDPHIWVFDGLLSDALLERVDDAFEEVKWKSMNGRQVRIVELRVDEQLAELPRTLCKISHIEEVAPCRNVWIMDVQGRDQGAHMDGWEVDKNRASMQHLDLSKCSVQTHKGFNTVIPTLSFVIYFNGVGGCTFPRAGLSDPTIPAKRGRILMFHNYNDSQRPAHNPAAVHYGVYGDSPKRVMTAGVLSHETPSELLGAAGGHRTRGLLYAPIMHRSNTSCGDPDPADSYMPSPPRVPTPPPKQVLQLLARSAEHGIVVEATTLGGARVAKVMLKPSDTLGALRRALPDAILVSGNEVLEVEDTILLQDTSLVQNLDLHTPAGDGVRAPSPSNRSSRSGAEAAVGAETLVEWDVVDTVFAPTPAHAAPMPSRASHSSSARSCVAS